MLRCHPLAWDARFLLVVRPVLRFAILAALVVGVAMALWTATMSARAAAPPVGSEDYDLMAPFQDEIRSLKVAGVLRCSWADGRSVRAERCQQSDDCPDGWMVRFRPSNDIGAPFDRWLPVRKDATARVLNPMGVPIAWYRGGVVVCFWPGNEI